MAGVLQHLRSSTLNKRPNPASMVDGQIAINYASGSPGAFFKDTNGNLVKVGPVHVGATAPNVSPASGGTAGNSLGEQWLDTSGGTYVFKIWDGAAWRSEAGEFVNSTGDTMTGSLTMGPSANLIFEGSTDDGFETTLTVVDPTADRTITLPNVSGTVVTTGDSGTVTSTMIADGTIVNADVNASAAIAGTKISPDFGSQTIQTTGVFSHALGSASSPTVTFTGDTNTGIYSPGADQVAVATNGTGRLFINDGGQIGIGTNTSLLYPLNIQSGSGADAIMLRGRLVDDKSTILFVNNGAATNLGWIQVDATGFAIATGSAPTERLRIDATGQIEAASLGTAAAPTFSWTGDPNTGIYSPGADQVAISTGGSGQVFVSSNGNLGVGTLNATNAAGKIHSRADGNEAKSLLVLQNRDAGASAGGAINFVNGGVDLSDNRYSYIRSIITGAGQNGNHLVFGTNANGEAPSERLRITSAGLVGVGTSSPGALLHVAGNTDNNVQSILAAGNDSNFRLVSINKSAANISGSELARFGIRYATGTDDSSGVQFFRGNTAAEGHLGLYTGGTTRLYVQGTTGNVGIGTTSPVAALGFGSSLDTTASNVSKIHLFNDGTSIYGFGVTAGQLNYRTGGLSDAHVWFAGATERARIDSSGRLLVGTSSAYAVSGFSRHHYFCPTQGEVNNHVIVGAASTGFPGLFFTRTRAASANSAATAVQNGDVLGNISFYGANGTDFSNQAAVIECIVDGDPFTVGDTTDLPGRLVFSTTADGASSPTERLRITSAGRVGIGTTSPGAVFEAAFTAGTGTPRVRLDQASSNPYVELQRFSGATNEYVGTRIRSSGNDAGLVFERASSALLGSQTFTESARIDSSGRLLVGTSSAVSVGGNFGATTGQSILVQTADIATYTAICTKSDGTGAAIALGKSRSGAIVSDGDSLGTVRFAGFDGTDYETEGARIAAFVDGAPGANDMPGRLVFSTTADGASSPTERMRITQDGSVLLNTGGNTIEVTTGTTTGAYYNNSGKQLVLARDGGAPLVVQRRSSDGTIQGFYRDGTLVGTISVTTTATAYNTSSDYRLKENVTAVTDGITRLQQLNPSRFNFIADPDKTVDGFLAHEVQTIVPEAITGEKDAVDDEGNPIYQGIDQSKLVPLLTAALQEAVAKIESIEDRLTAAGI